MVRKKISEILRWIAYQGLQKPILSLVVTIIIATPLYYVYTLCVKFPSSLRQVSDGIFGGAIASMVTYAIVRYFFIESEIFGARRWFNFGSSKVWIVPTYLDYNRQSPTYYVTPPFDAQASGILTNIIKDIGLQYPASQVIGSHRDPRDFFQDNLVIFCLPYRNVFSRLFLGILYDIYYKGIPREQATRKENYDKYLDDINCELEYFGIRRIEKGDYIEWQIQDFTRPKGDSEWLRSSININHSYNCADIAGQMQHDYAMIIRIANPFNPSAVVIMLMGIHGIGTLGSSIHTLHHSNKLFETHKSEDQLFTLRVNYMIPNGLTNYVDAELSNGDMLVHECLSNIDFLHGGIRRR